MQNKSSCIVVLGTGGTIAGTSAPQAPEGRYQAAQLDIAVLLAGVPGLAEAAAGCALTSEPVAQVDSKDMDFEVWQALLARVEWHLARAEVRGVVITHGTDTLEETAYFLHRTLRTSKPVALTAAMRPATSAQADGPAHLRQAVSAVAQGGWAGVAVVLQGEAHHPCLVRKVHPRALQAFTSGEAGPVARWQNPHWQRLRDLTPDQAPVPPSVRTQAAGTWPWTEVLHSHAGARAQAVQSWVDAGVAGLVVVATGNGTLHHVLVDALQAAQRTGVRVWRCSRCADAGLDPQSDDGSPFAASALSPAKARVALMLSLMSP
ncbi:MAG: asparaginase [Pseudomonadota bacterium]